MLRRSFHLLPNSLSLGMVLTLALSAAPGCKPDICKDPNLTAEQRCRDCKPKDDELLARLNPTQLPWPVRKRIEFCADQIHTSDPRNFVTKQALRECTNADPTLDSNTKMAIAELINRSNLMEQVDLDNYHGLCLANAGAGREIPVSPAVPVVPPEGNSATSVPPSTTSAAPASPPPPAAPASPAAPSGLPL